MSNRKPLLEGRGIKVFRADDLNTFLVKEGWGPYRRVTEGYSEKQITQLRKEYNSVNRVDPDKPAYKALIKHLDSLSQDQLKELANAKIKFVSSLARNRLK